MNEDNNTGIWSAKTGLNYQDYYYQYRITLYHPNTQKIEVLTTTDPYSLSLSSNSEYSQIVSLDSTDTKPEGWQQQQDNLVSAPEDNIFYETKIAYYNIVCNKIL